MVNLMTRKKKESLALLTILFIGIALLGETSAIPSIGVRPIVRSIEYITVSYQIRGYSTTETENFIIRHQTTDKEAIRFVADTAEDKFRDAIAIFKYTPKRKVRLIVYDDAMDMMKSTLLNRGGRPPMGLYFGNSLHIVNPKIWYENNDSYKDEFYSEGPLLHELVHLLTDHVGKGNFPIWFTEGVSLYFEYLIDEYQWGKELLEENINYSVDELHNEFYNINQYKAYTRSFRLIKNYVDENGVEELIDLINKLGEGESLTNYYHLFQ